MKQTKIIKLFLLTIFVGSIVFTNSCNNGGKGKGDGKASANLDIPAGDFTSTATKGQSDGAIFWKIEEGRKSMPTFKKKLGEEDVWQLVAFIRTLK